MWLAPESFPVTAPLANTRPKFGKSKRVRSPEQIHSVWSICPIERFFQTVSNQDNQAETLSPLAGRPAPKSMLVDLARLERDYYERVSDFADPNQRVSFGTSGHRGSSLRGTFTESHILAITQAISEFRHMKGIDGPLYLGKDTH